MSYEFVFVRSIVLTIIIGLFLLVTGRAARKRGCIVAFWVFAAVVHLIWWCLPELKGGWSEAGRWLVSAWVGAVLTALFLTLPVGLFLVARRLLGRRSTAGMRVPLTFVAASLNVGIGVSFGTVGGPVVREEVVHVKGLPEGLDGLRIANIGDVHIGRFHRARGLCPGDRHRQYTQGGLAGNYWRSYRRSQSAGANAGRSGEK